jgi:PAS domain S-box-containing protein
LETIFNTVASAIISIDQKGLVTNFNKAAERIFGYTASEVIGKNVKILMPEKVASQHDQYIKDYLGMSTN